MTSMDKEEKVYVDVDAEDTVLGAEFSVDDVPLSVEISDGATLTGYLDVEDGSMDRARILELTSFRHQQIRAQKEWYIEHNLGFYPSVFVADTGGNWVVGDIQYHDKNSLTIKFSASFSGEAYFS